MNLTVVMLVCVGALMACAALVFIVETAVAYLLHEQEPTPTHSEIVTMAAPQVRSRFEGRRAA